MCGLSFAFFVQHMFDGAFVGLWHSLQMNIYYFGPLHSLASDHCVLFHHPAWVHSIQRKTSNFWTRVIGDVCVC